MASKRTLILAAAAAAASSAVPIAAAVACQRPTYNEQTFPDVPFTSMVVFGDSFSDVGNIHVASNESQPGVWSYDGRYSDGRVWHEYVAQFLGWPTNASSSTPSLIGGSNYAWGGATGDNDYIDAFSTYLDADVPAVNQQIATYLEDRSGEAVEDSLHVLYSGYNDYWWYVHRNYTTSEGRDLNFTNVYTNVAREMVQNVERLYDAGARSFLVSNVMNMSTWAEAQLQTREALDAYNILVAGHNAWLSNLLSDFEEAHNDAVVYDFDVFGAFECLNDSRNFLGIRNVQDPCHPSESADCGDIFSYKFWDWYHPTAHAHQYSSTSVLQSIYDKEVERSRMVHQYAKTSLRKRA